MYQLADIRPYLDKVEKLIDSVKVIPEHYIVNEKFREVYLRALLDVKFELLDMVDEQKYRDGEPEQS